MRLDPWRRHPVVRRLGAGQLSSIRVCFPGTHPDPLRALAFAQRTPLLRGGTQSRGAVSGVFTQMADNQRSLPPGVV